jgi:hypothetical protein
MDDDVSLRDNLRSQFFDLTSIHLENPSEHSSRVGKPPFLPETINENQLCPQRPRYHVSCTDFRSPKLPRRKTAEYGQSVAHNEYHNRISGLVESARR